MGPITSSETYVPPPYQYRLCMRNAYSVYGLYSTTNVAALRKISEIPRVEGLGIFDTPCLLIFSYLSLEESRFNMP
jgi:hypothetical protein